MRLNIKGPIKKNLRMGTIAITSLSLMVAFQNCGAPFDAAIENENSTASAPLAPQFSSDRLVTGEDNSYASSEPVSDAPAPSEAGDSCQCTPVVEVASLPEIRTVYEPLVGPEWTRSLASRHNLNVETLKAMYRAAVAPLCASLQTFLSPALPDPASLSPGECLSIEGDINNNNLNGSTSHDYIFGATGDDHIFGGEGKDFLLGGRGRDYLLGGPGADFLMGGIDEDLFIAGGQGNDFVRGSTAGMGLVLKSGATGSALPDNWRDNSNFLDSSVPGLSRNGEAEQGRVAGGLGNDYVSGGPMADILYGNAGDDVIEGQEGPDRIFGDEANDFTAEGLTYNDVIYGERRDTSDLVGPSGGFVLSNYFDDYINAGPGDDVVIAGLGDDMVDAGPGNDVVIGNEGNDQLLGWDGNDYLNGGPGDDEIYGGNGDDVLRDNAGTNNQLYGGPGNDTYVYFPRLFDASPVLNMVIDDDSGTMDRLYCLESRARSYRSLPDGSFEMTMERILDGYWIEVGTITIKNQNLASGRIEAIHGCLNR